MRENFSSSVFVCHPVWRSLWPRQVKTQILVKGRNCPGHKGTESEPPIVMADVWGANFGHLYPTSVPDDWWWRCFMRPICLIAPSPTFLSRLSLRKQDSKDIRICPPFILPNTFIGSVPFWSEGWLVQDIVWKGKQTCALVSVQRFCESQATHFHTLGKCPTNATIVTKFALLQVISGSILRYTLWEKETRRVHL